MALPALAQPADVIDMRQGGDGVYREPTADERREDDLLADLLRKADEAEEASRDAREKSERDDDYYHNKQWTQDEFNALKKRGQAPISFNVIRARVDFFQGLEKKQRRDPKAWPRNPQDQQSADAFTDAMRYVLEDAKYQSVRSAAWKDIIIKGYGGIEVWVTPARDGNYDIKMKRIPWDRLRYDPHSAEPDFTDSAYDGIDTWYDLDEAVAKYGEENRNKLEASFGASTISQTYDDKPRDTIWADRKRKRVRVHTMWCRHGGDWWVYEFTKGGILDAMPSPYMDEDGGSMCMLFMESCFVDRENNRYGAVRDLIDPQDEINHRRSKGLHLLTMQGVIADEGAVANVNETKRELKKPDFFVQKTPGANFELVRHTDLSAGQQQMGREAMGYVAQHGPNEALLGKGTTDQSGRAIEAQQQGGLIEHADLLDTLRRLDDRIFRAVACLIKQFWTAEKWVRITDDEMAPKWVGLNIPVPAMQQAMDPMTGQPVEQPMVDPMTGQPMIAGVENPVAELDVDIILTDAPDIITSDQEAFQAFTQLLGMQLPPPFLRLAIEMYPGLSAKRKKQMLDMLEQMMAPPQPDPAQVQAQQEAQQIAKDKAISEIEGNRARAMKDAAQGEKAKAEARATVPEMVPVPVPVSAFAPAAPPQY